MGEGEWALRRGEREGRGWRWKSVERGERRLRFHILVWFGKREKSEGALPRVFIEVGEGSVQCA